MSNKSKHPGHTLPETQTSVPAAFSLRREISRKTIHLIHRFRTARYNFTEPPPDSLKDAGEGASASGTTDPKASRAEKGTHEPIEEMPSTLFMMLKVRKTCIQQVCFFRPSSSCCFRLLSVKLFIKLLLWVVFILTLV